MRILVLGAGAVGGYFGGRLLEAKRDVTFLVRPARAAELARSGLIIRSRAGDASFSRPTTILSENLHQSFDLVLLTCKAYDLEAAIASLAPAVGAHTAILPLLNGMRHLDMLSERFGRERVLGGQCLIAATLNSKHEVVHLDDTHELSFGELDGTLSERVRAFASSMEGARFESHASPEILAEMWEKWVFLASGAGSACLMRAAIGDIAVSPGGTDFVLGLIEECCGIAEAEGYPVRPASLKRTRDMLTAVGSTLMPSMLRDIERNGRIEADHIIGDLLRRGTQAGLSLSDLPALKLVYAHLKAYEARRTRTVSVASTGPVG
jgi:2-dehydropantoate 2-reductase